MQVILIREIRINYLKSVLIESFKIVNGISNYDRHFSLKWKFTVKTDFKI